MRRLTTQRRQTYVKGAEAARRQLPALVTAAAEGRVTVITRHGRAIAALVPADSVARANGQSPITSIAGTGKGLWGKNSTRTFSSLRDEWNR